MANPYITPESENRQYSIALEPHNAWLVTPRGNHTSVNISPEAAVVWTRYGFKVEWFGASKAVAA